MSGSLLVAVAVGAYVLLGVGAYVYGYYRGKYYYYPLYRKEKRGNE